MHRGAHAGAQVGGARGHHAVVLREGKLEPLDAVDHIQRRLEPVKHLVQHSALLHAHDAQVVLFAHPDDEAAVRRHVASPSVRPVRRDARRRQVRVRRHVLKHDVVVHQLLVRRLVDKVGVPRRERVVSAAVLVHGHQLLKRLAHLGLHRHPVVLAHGARQRKLLQVAPHAHPHRQLGQPERRKVQHAALGQPLDPLEAPVVHVLGILRHAVVVGQHLGEEGLERVVVGGLHGVAPHARVGILDARVDALQQPLLARLVQRLVVRRIEMLHRTVAGVARLDGGDALQRSAGGCSLESGHLLAGLMSLEAGLDPGGRLLLVQHHRGLCIRSLGFGRAYRRQNRFCRRQPARDPLGPLLLATAAHKLVPRVDRRHIAAAPRCQGRPSGSAGPVSPHPALLASSCRLCKQSRR